MFSKLEFGCTEYFIFVFILDSELFQPNPNRYPPLNKFTIIRFEYVVQLDLASERDLHSIPS